LGAPDVGSAMMYRRSWPWKAPPHLHRQAPRPVDLEFRAFCSRRRLPASSTLQLGRAWDAWQAERYQRGEISQRPGYTDNPFRPR